MRTTTMPSTNAHGDESNVAHILSLNTTNQPTTGAGAIRALIGESVSQVGSLSLAHARDGCEGGRAGECRLPELRRRLINPTVGRRGLPRPALLCSYCANQATWFLECLVDVSAACLGEWRVPGFVGVRWGSLGLFHERNGPRNHWHLEETLCRFNYLLYLSRCACGE